MRTAQIATGALVVGQVEVVGIAGSDTRAAVDAGGVPAQEVRDVAHVVAVGSAAARALAIAVPGGPEHLAVAVGRRGAAPGDDSQDTGARGLRARAEARLLVDQRHLHSLGNPPALACRLCAPEPRLLLAKDAAEVVGIAGRRRRAAGGQRQRQPKCGADARARAHRPSSAWASASSRRAISFSGQSSVMPCVPRAIARSMSSRCLTRQARSTSPRSSA